jgi:toxin FitB
MKYILDTNAISEIIKPRPDADFMSWLDTIPNRDITTSVFVVGEIHKGIHETKDKDRRKKLYSFAEHVLHLFEGRIIGINLPDCARWGLIVAETSKRGLTRPLSDSLIAAQAIQNNLTLVTRNKKDFAPFQDFGLSLICPWGE